MCIYGFDLKSVSVKSDCEGVLKTPAILFFLIVNIFNF